jgi:hypothetical protein
MLDGVPEKLPDVTVPEVRVSGRLAPEPVRVTEMVLPLQVVSSPETVTVETL